MIHEDLWKRLAAADPADVCTRCIIQHDASRGAYILDMLGQTYAVVAARKVIEKGVAGPTVVTDIHFYVSTAQYLLSAKDTPRSGEWVTEKQLAYGDFFFATPHPLPTAKIVKRFGTDVEAFVKAGAKLGGKRLSFGDAAYELKVFPRLPLAYVLWRADEEFPARVQILFDSTAEQHMAVDALWSAMHIVSTELLAAGEGA
ncbi:MAG: DUF3786 domain-containing protein [Planctomycetota bacterium]|nr:DUF3786 domain-containing protein [Planctomycetota bacterium]